MLAAGNEMNVGIVEAGQEQFAIRVDHSRLGAMPCFDVCIRSHSDDPVVEHGNRLSRRLSGIYRIDLGIVDDQIGSGLGLRPSCQREK